MTRLIPMLVACMASALPVAAQTIDVVVDGAGGVPLDLARYHARAGDGTLWVVGNGSDNLLRVDPDGTVTEVVSVWPTLDGPSGLAVAPDGSVVVTDFLGDAVLRWTPAGEVELVVDADGDGAANGLDGPRELAVDAVGNVFVSGRFSNNLLRIAPDGTVTELVGPDGAGPGEPLTEARGVAVDSAGNAYVAGVTSDNVLRVTPAGVVSQVIGPEGNGFGAALNGPVALVLAPDDTLYVAAIHSSVVLKRTPGGALSTLMTSFGDGLGNGLVLPWDLALASDGSLYVAGLGSDNVFAIAPGGTVSEVMDLSGDGVGNLCDDPTDLLVEPGDTVVVGCAQSGKLLRIDGSSIRLVADMPGFGGDLSALGDGGLALDASGRIIVSRFSGDDVIRLEPGGGQTLLLDASGGPLSGFRQPWAIALDDQDRPHVTSLTSSKVFRIEPDDSVTVVMGPEGDGAGNGLQYPYDLLFDAAGRLYVLGEGSDNVLRRDPDGTITQVVGPAGTGPTGVLDTPRDLELTADGSIYIPSISSRSIHALRPDGTVELIIQTADVYPASNKALAYELSSDALGRIYSGSTYHGVLWRVDPDGSFHELWTATLPTEHPGQIIVEPSGAVLMTTSANDDRMLRILPSGSEVEIISSAGAGPGFELNGPTTPRLTGPGRFDLAVLGPDAIFDVDLELCGDFALLPGALPSDGSGPLLTGEGQLCGGDPLLIQIRQARPNTLAWLVLGEHLLGLPFEGGTMVPSPDLLLTAPLDSEGAVDLLGAWPVGLPAGVSLWLQAWIPEPSAGYQATNGLRFDTL